MRTARTTAAIAGALLIAGTVAGVLSVVPSVEGDAYLIAAAAHAGQLTMGAFFQLLMAVAYVGVAVLLFPVLRAHDESLALGFVGSRIVAGAFLVAGAVALLLLLRLSQGFVSAGAPDASLFHVIGGLMRAGRDLLNHVGMILAVSVGGLMLYSILYRARLVPRWLAGWGFAGTVLAMVASFLVMFRRVEIVSPPYLLLNVPIAVEEMVLAGWLIVKGFSPQSLRSSQQ